MEEDRNMLMNSINENCCCLMNNDNNCNDNNMTRNEMLKQIKCLKFAIVELEMEMA